MATNKIQTGLRISESVYKKLRYLSNKEQRSLNNLMEYMIQQYITRYEQEHGEIPELPEET